jgi:hypothetical protein
MVAVSTCSGCAPGQLVVLGVGASPVATSFVSLSKLSVHAAAGSAGLAHFLGPPNRLLVHKDYTTSVKVNIMEVVFTCFLTCGPETGCARGGASPSRVPRRCSRREGIHSSVTARTCTTRSAKACHRTLYGTSRRAAARRHADWEVSNDAEEYIGLLETFSGMLSFPAGILNFESSWVVCCFWCWTWMTGDH